MIISLENLFAGTDWWLNSNWGADFVNADYTEIFDLKRDGLTRNWWVKTVDRLWAWKAIRSPKQPNTKKSIIEAGEVRLPMLSELFRLLEQQSHRPEPLISDFEWDDISELFWLANEIKHSPNRYASPVFASKMCHFIYPRVFPVLDNLATGVLEYEFFWRGMRDEWSRFKSKDTAVAHLRSLVGPEDSIHKWYPFETKVIELCQIAYYQRSCGHVIHGNSTDGKIWMTSELV